MSRQKEMPQILRIPRSENDFIWTQSGRKFWPLDPRPQEICIKDIAHALSRICRFTGHCRTFYSVADHSIRVADLILAECRRLGKSMEESAVAGLQGLLHDGSEAFLCDLSGPMKGCKRFSHRYEKFEAGLQAAIATQFSLPVEASAMVRWADKVLLATEMRDLMPEGCFSPDKRWPPLPEKIVPRSIEASEEDFLRCFRKWMEAR
jgi:hypothetical protein